jgi:hypothetical protein
MKSRNVPRAANAEESASASEQLNRQSPALMAVVQELQILVGGDSSIPQCLESLSQPSGCRSGA